MSTYIIDFKSHKTKCKTSLNTTSNWSSKIWRFTTWSICRFCITLWYNFMYTSLYKTNYLTDFHWKRIWSAPAQYTSKWPAHLQDLFSFKSCTWRGSSTFEILAAEISYIHCNPIQSTKPQFRIFFPQYAVTPTSRGLERNTYLVCACECSKINKVKQKVTELQSWTKVCLNLYLFFSSGNNWPIDMAAWLCEWELWELPWDTHDACKISQENDHIFKMGIEETIGHNQASTKRILFLCTQKQPQWKKP